MLLPIFDQIYRFLSFYWYFNIAPSPSFSDWYTNLIAMIFRSLFGG